MKNYWLIFKSLSLIHILFNEQIFISDFDDDLLGDTNFYSDDEKVTGS